MTKRSLVLSEDHRRWSEPWVVTRVEFQCLRMAAMSRRVFVSVAEAWRGVESDFHEAAREMGRLGRWWRALLWRVYHREGCYYGEDQEGLERCLRQRLLLDMLGYDYPTGRWHR